MSERSATRVSVLMPVHDRERYVGEAVESVLATGYPNLEIVVVDDGSTDATPRILADLQARHPSVLRVVRHPGGGNRGQMPSRNLALAEATGDYVCFLDSDDLMLPHRFERAIPMLDGDPSLDGVIEAVELRFEDAAQRARWGDRAPRYGPLDADVTPDAFLSAWLLERRCTMVNCGILFRARLLERTGRFRTAAVLSEDFHLWLRMVAAGRFAAGAVGRPVAVYRRHPENDWTPRFLDSVRDVDVLRDVRAWARRSPHVPPPNAAVLEEAYRRKARWCLATLRERAGPPVQLALAGRLLARDPAWIADRAFLRSAGRALRETLGAALLDVPGFARNLRGRSPRGERHWTRVRNRRDRIRWGPDGLGASPDARWTSRIHACHVFPALGARLQARALAEWPPAFAPRPRPAAEHPPEVAFVIGHRGLDRLPLLSVVLSSLAGQDGPSIECVVVEQTAEREIEGLLPGWVTYAHAASPRTMPFSRSWAFNVGARATRAPLLVFHDNDMIIPARYAAELRSVRARGYEVMNLKRFVFELDRSATERVVAGGPISGAPRSVVQNLEGGGSVAIDRQAFFALGGFDEAFVGWGGEDNEFWERASALLRTWRWGYLPIVHLFHEAQAGKGSAGRPTAALLDARSRIPPADRAAELSRRRFGSLAGPEPAFRAPGEERG